MKRVVCDTGPLLHLREAGCLTILQATGRILIPQAVQTELMSLDPSWQRERPEWVEVWELESRPSEEAMGWLRSGVLDLGEAEALALAAQILGGGHGSLQPS